MTDRSAAIDPDQANAARIYHYNLGGKHYFPVDKEVSDRATRNFVGGPDAARIRTRAHRDFLVRAIRHLVLVEGVRQFLDIGTGIPDDDNVPATAQAADPTCRIVAVDHDETVLAHADELLTSTPEGAARFIDADVRRPAKIVREARKTLDFDEPVAVILAAVLHLVADDDFLSPAAIVQNLVDAVPSGSYLLVSHIAPDIPPHEDAVKTMADSFNSRADKIREPLVPRTRPEVVAYFDGLDLVEPGVVPVHDWHPDRPDLDSTFLWGGIARKP